MLLFVVFFYNPIFHKLSHHIKILKKHLKLNDGVIVWII